MKTQQSQVLAFLLTKNSPSSVAYARAVSHLRQLADCFDCSLVEHRKFGWQLLLCYRGEIAKLKKEDGHGLAVCIGPTSTQAQSGHDNTLVETTPHKVRDRFLYLKLSAEELNITTDYAGTIPCFYSTRAPFSASNIEPLVVLDSGSRLDDIDTSAMYAFLRYSHFLWNRTLFRHVRMQEPDSRYTWDSGDDRVPDVEPTRTYLKTVKGSDSRCGMRDALVAREAFDLNQKLVTTALSSQAGVVLPLSSGYDSRMILVALAESKALRERLFAATYGPWGSIEVKAAERLCHKFSVRWERVGLPLRFLERRYLERIGLVFGSSLHFHGMYQMEFADVLRPHLAGGVLTSGFMTGVPAGQHVSLLGIREKSPVLNRAMNRFSQSRSWTDDDLYGLCSRFKPAMLDDVETEFHMAFDRFEGSIVHKSIMLDVWTRQRNWISYYPRTMEWYAPHISPHMCPEYVNFFLSLSERHLTDRRAVELMFRFFYRKAAGIPSNSNGLGAISGPYNFGLSLVQKLRRTRFASLVPGVFLDQALDFDIPALRYSKRNGVWPVFHLNKEGKDFFYAFFPEQALDDVFCNALSGSNRDYLRLASLQGIAYGVNLVT